MGHRPYPRADRARRQAIRRHGLRCAVDAAFELVHAASYLDRRSFDYALRFQRYYLDGKLLGVPDRRADELLHQVQGERAGKAPTLDELAAATALLKAEPV